MMAPSLLPWLCVTLYNQMQNITTREMRRDMKWVSTLDFHITHLRHLLQQKSAFHIYMIRCLELCLTQKWHHFDIIISTYVVLNLYDFFFVPWNTKEDALKNVHAALFMQWKWMGTRGWQAPKRTKIYHRSIIRLYDWCTEFQVFWSHIALCKKQLVTIHHFHSLYGKEQLGYSSKNRAWP